MQRLRKWKALLINTVGRYMRKQMEEVLAKYGLSSSPGMLFISLDHIAAMMFVKPEKFTSEEKELIKSVHLNILDKGYIED